MASSIQQTISTARAAFATKKTLDIEFRKQQIKQVYKLLEENEKLFVESVKADLGKPRFETILAEVDFEKNDALAMLHNLDAWTSKEYVSKTLVTIGDKPYLYAEPYGLVLVLGTWNYPIMVTIAPLLGAIAAGNVVIVKPSEFAPATADLLARLIPAYLDKECFHVITGGPEVAQDLLKEKFDSIFYTGSTSIGRHVHAAAAKHLTPVILEMGGKSPVYMDDSVIGDMEVACRRLIWGKVMNGGQTCVAPDYLLCSKQVEVEFLKHAPEILKKFFNESYGDLTPIINDRHFARVNNLLQSTEGKIVIGGVVDEKARLIHPTIVSDVRGDDALMQEEIFAPIFPIVTVNSVDEAIQFINSRDKPLSLYVFSNRSETVERFNLETSSGSICVNDTCVHLTVDTLPFGGVGASGLGTYHGQFSFEAFSHKKAVLVRTFNPVLEWVASKRYPPYSNGHLVRLIRVLRRRKFVTAVMSISLNSIALFAAGAGSVIAAQTVGII